MTAATPKIVFFDIDETLRRKETAYLPHSAVAAIKALRARNIHTAIATGRSPYALPTEIEALFDEQAIDILVGINGQYNCAFATDTKQLLSSHPLAIEDISSIVSYMRDRHRDYAFISATKIAVSRDSAMVAEVLRSVAQYEVNPNLHLEESVYQMLLFLDDPTCRQLQLDGQIPASLETIRWHPECIDLLNKNGGKANGIREVCRGLDIPLASTMAFGDGLNDMDMFRTVGTGIAMGDARDELKALASHVTGTVEEHGIASALRHYRLIA